MGRKTYTKVWGDNVHLPELTLAAVIGVTITMGIYLLVRFLLVNYSTVEPNVINGYALIGGIAGCFISGIVSGRSFRPKREVIEGTEEMDLEEVLIEAGSSLEIEREALNKESKEVIAEMESLELYSLLSLISKDSPNYKPEYKAFVERKVHHEH